MISTDDDDGAEDEDDGVTALNVTLPNMLFDLVVEVRAVVEVEVDEENGEENRPSLAFDTAAGTCVILNIGAGASTGFDLAIGSLIFLLSKTGAFGAGNDMAGILMSVLFSFSCTLGISTGSGGISCSLALPALRCFEMLLFRILVTCLLLVVIGGTVDDDL